MVPATKAKPLLESPSSWRRVEKGGDGEGPLWGGLKKGTLSWELGIPAAALLDS